MQKYFTALTSLLILIVLSTNAQVNFDNQVIVYFKSGIQRNAPSNTTATISSANILNVLNSYGIPASNVIPSFPNFNEADTVINGTPKTTGGLTGEASRQMNRARVFTITVTNSSTKQSFINSLNSMSEALYAETNGKVSNNLIPVDGRFNQQWGMRNLTVPGADIHAEPAWDIFTGNPNAIIAVIDNGVDRNHNDLNTKILGGDNGFVIDVDGLNRQFNHGSHVAGIAGAITNNAGNNGVAGVDWQASLHPKNIFDGNGDPDITQSIIDAVNFAADVWTFNNSWGTRNQDGTPGRYSVTIRSAFAQAYRSNRVSCIAMGNHHVGLPDANDIPAFPASINSGVIAVGATDINDNAAGFSARGAHIDVSAPGVGIWSTNFNNNYIDLSGTSMATPHVAGLASLLKGFNTNLANDDIEQIIRLTADNANALNFPGFDNQMGTGRINAQRALQRLQAPNQLFQWNTTGGTVFSTSASMTRIFLGFPGLADAAYVVKRSEVRTNVTFPVTMCTMVGGWGRGVGTTGYREEQGRSFGEGICEVVAGTLTNTSATLRTWIYEVWAAGGQYLGFFPNNAQNTIFQYTVLGVPRPNTISGSDIFCTTSTNYTIPNLPTGATVVWSTSPTGIATPNTPTLPQTTLTRNNNGVITLTSNISNACGGTIVITKPNITVGTPSISSIFAQRVGGSCYYDAAVTFSGLGTIVEFSFNNVNWQPGVKTGNTYTMGELFQGAGYQQVYARTSNSCGKGAVFSKNLYIPAPPPNCMYGPASQVSGKITVFEEEALDRNLINIYPNPATNKVVVETPTLSNNEWISVYDMTGKLMHKEKVNKTKTVMNISGYGAGVYLIRVEADGHLIKSEKVVKEK